ncbi:FtsX-like permease family protein [Candidatus Shapirobacteria bacterium]|nr:FtsX-like permease family protein [Candidatus Shapirobacteria bacterium]
MNIYRNTWHHIRRSPFQSITAIVTMTLSFFALSTFAIVSNGMNSLLNYFETKPEITIFLKDGLDKSTIENLQTEISNYTSIKEIKFISKEKALTIYKEQNKNSPLLTEMVTASILPASFEVSVSDVKVLEQISQNFSAKKDQVDEIIYQKDIITSILSWTNIIRQIGIVTVTIFSGLTFLVVLVIIGMKITNRKEEINISRLLGASKDYVKAPFLIEGTIYGLVGGFLGPLVSLTLISIYKSQINQFFDPVLFISTDLQFILVIWLICEAAGVTIGYLSSWIGSNRYIKF